MNIDFDQIYHSLTNDELIVNLRNDKPDASVNSVPEEKEVALDTIGVKSTGPLAEVMSNVLEKLYAFKKESTMSGLLLKKTIAINAENTQPEVVVYVTSNKLLKDTNELTASFNYLNGTDANKELVILSEEAEEIDGSTITISDYSKANNIPVHYSLESFISKYYTN
jgi:hypothetical protein